MSNYLISNAAGLLGATASANTDFKSNILVEPSTASANTDFKSNILVEPSAAVEVSQDLAKVALPSLERATSITTSLAIKENSMTRNDPVARPIPEKDWNVLKEMEIKLPLGINSTNLAEIVSVVRSTRLDGYNDWVGPLLLEEDGVFRWNPDFAQALGELHQFCSKEFDKETSGYVEVMEIEEIRDRIGRLHGSVGLFYRGKDNEVTVAGPHPEFPHYVVEEVLGQMFPRDVPGAETFYEKIKELADAVIARRHGVHQVDMIDTSFN
jgi:hypothetical protein